MVNGGITHTFDTFNLNINKIVDLRKAIKNDLTIIEGQLIVLKGQQKTLKKLQKRNNVALRKLRPKSIVIRIKEYFTFEVNNG
ncbi:hypothetical protein LCGC14_0646520 [marine sediment metagenome]|uniref:Uncharacterized protein n=1 Tax=marine sediment metagenome TaxID=412755 RepID=A0A0F9RH72_9ZZZZ